MDQILKGWARPRPVRIAFLVEDCEHSQAILDGVFANCYARWGGRFSLIVPCEQGRVTSTYWSWLEAYDPDVVYSYVDLDRAGVLEIHERLSPSEYIQHELGHDPRFDAGTFRPNVRHAEFLSSLSTVFRLARHAPAKAGEPPVRIVDSYWTEAPSRFFTDNFGTYMGSRAASYFPQDAADAAMLLPVVSPDRAKAQNGLGAGASYLTSELEAFQEFAGRNATSLAQLSLRFAPKLNIRIEKWSTAFNLVVGESFNDRLLFWNARLLIPQWLDDDVCCLRVTLAELRDPSYLASVGDMLKGRNHVNGGSGGQAQAIVRSSSLTEQELNEALDLIKSTKPWCVVRAEPARRDDLIPSDAAIESAQEGNRFGETFAPRPDWQEFSWTGATARPVAAAPDHLSDAPNRQHFVAGLWATDLRLQASGPGPRFYSNGAWVLPRRWRMVDAFQLEFSTSKSEMLPARRGRHGVLTVFLNQDRQLTSIHIPSPYNALRHALVIDGSWTKPDGKVSDTKPPKKAAWMQLSNEARYFNGIVGMAGGVSFASQLLLHPFLRAVFSQWGGAPGKSADKIARVVKHLGLRRHGQTPFDITNLEDRQALALQAVRAADELKKDVVYIPFQVLAKQWADYRKAYWDKVGKPETPDDGYDWEADDAHSLEGCLQELRRRKMVFQGYNWTCPNCHFKNWSDMTRMAPVLTCVICREEKDAPVSFDWEFRANEFLIESLRHHSVQSVLWVTSRLYERAKQSVIIAESSQFGADFDSDDPSAEADIIAVIDGECIICEVKASWNYVRPSDLKKIVSAAQTLRPDKLILAVMDSEKKPASYFLKTVEQLAKIGVGLEVMTLNDDDIDGWPSLGLVERHSVATI